MQTVAFTTFRKNASDLFHKVEHGETLVVIRHGKPVAEIVPFTADAMKPKSWKTRCHRFHIKGADLSSSILEDREAGA